MTTLLQDEQGTELTNTALPASSRQPDKTAPAEVGMAVHVILPDGDHADGVIVSQTEHGAFVRLDNNNNNERIIEENGDLAGVPWRDTWLLPTQNYTDED